MATAFYRIGTVAVTQSSKVVTGTGTKWTQGANKPLAGDVFLIDQQFHEVELIVSDTELHLFTPYIGANQTGAKYGIMRNASLNISSRIAASVSIAINQKQKMLTELNVWMTDTTGPTVPLTDVFGVENQYIPLPLLTKKLSDIVADTENISNMLSDMQASLELAKKYANAGKNVVVEAGNYSAKHFSLVALDHANAAHDSETKAEAAKTISESARDTAQQYKSQAEGYKNAASQSATNAASSETSADAHEQTAKRWATNPKNSPVTTNPDQFSAFHWAETAKDSATAVSADKQHVDSVKTQIDHIKTDIDTSKSHVDSVKSSIDGISTDLTSKYTEVVSKASEVQTNTDRTETYKDEAETARDQAIAAKDVAEAIASPFVSGGTFTPTAQKEYPDIPAHGTVIIFTIAGLPISSPYTFTTGDLVGKVIDDDDYLILTKFTGGVNRWSVMKLGNQTITSVNGQVGPSVVLTKTDIGLPNVSNWTATSSITDASTSKYATAKGVKTAADNAAQALAAANAKWTAVDATTVVKGIVVLDDSVSSTSVVKAGTANAVKKAYDRGTTALNAANGKWTYSQSTIDARVRAVAPTLAPKAHTHSATQITSGVMAVDRLPLSTLTDKGIVQLSSAVNSSSEGIAATSKAARTAYDKGVSAYNLANGKWTAADATDVVKGIVKLNDAINSSSKTTAATANAAKKAYDRGSAALTEAGKKWVYNQTTIDNRVKAVAPTVAPKAHQHSATDITSGTLNKDRLPNATTSVKGAAQLSSSISSTSEVLAATPKAVKSAYDHATTALNTANSKLSRTQANQYYPQKKGTSIIVPVGDTADRPASEAGLLRYNNQTEEFEGYGTEWGSIGGGGVPKFIYKDANFTIEKRKAYALDMADDAIKTVTIPDHLVDGDWFAVKALNWTGKAGVHYFVATTNDQWEPVHSVITSATRKMRISQNSIVYLQKIKGKWSVVDGIGESDASVPYSELIDENKKLKEAIDSKPNENLFINGDFSVWQRNTGFTNPSDGSYHCDRWVSRSPSATSFKVVKGGNTLYKNYLTMELRGATSFPTLEQRIECDYSKEGLQGEKITLSMITHFDNAIECNFELNWRKLSDGSNTGGSSTRFNVGTDRQESNITMTVPTIPNQVDGEEYVLRCVAWVGTGATPDGTYRFVSMKLENGSVATPFVPDDPATNLAKCQRYYVGLDIVGVGDSMSGAVYAPMYQLDSSGNSSARCAGGSLPVPMRHSPNVTGTWSSDAPNMKQASPTMYRLVWTGKIPSGAYGYASLQFEAEL